MSRTITITAFGICLLLGGCALNSSEDRDRDIAYQSGSVQLLTDLEVASTRQAYIDRRQLEPAAEYRPVAVDGVWRATHRAFGFEHEFTPGAVSIAEAGGDWNFSFALTSWGRGEETMPVSPAVVTENAGLVTYERAEIAEWYRNGPLGLEQGFLLRERPEGDEGAVHLVGRLGGDLKAQASAALDQIEFVDGSGEVAFTLADLFVFDADGAPVESRIEVIADELHYWIDDRSARYPLQVDPLYGVSDTELDADGAMISDAFGYDVDVDGQLAVVGAPFDDVGGRNSGAAYIFRRTSTGWVQEAKLEGSVSTSWDNFGNAVAISGNTVVVGSWADNDRGSRSGSIYIFERSGELWTEVAKFVAFDGHDSGFFGHAVDIYANEIVVGAYGDRAGGYQAGAVYVYRRGPTGWAFAQKLRASDAAARHAYGFSVAVEQDSLVVGARQYGGGTVYTGGAYVYRRVAGAWADEVRLTTTDLAHGDEFGYAVEVDDDLVAISAPGTDGVGSDSGRVYLFERSTPGAWSLSATLNSPSAAGEERFGHAIAVDGSNLAVGVPGRGLALSNRGEVEVFREESGLWSRELSLAARDAEADDQLGYSAALSDAELVAGAIFGTVRVADSGSMYHWQIGLTNGSACERDIQCGSGFCVDGVCCAGACGDGAADDCQACSVAAGGVTDGVCSPLARDTVCRESEGVCDAAEVCDGATMLCPADVMAAAGTECRGAEGACGVAEVCDGFTAACPADVHAEEGVVCRAGEGTCDVAETCDGVSDLCPADALQPEGFLCRSSAGACDVAEMCTGLEATCPEDQLFGPTVECRASAGACDVAEMCDGTQAACPEDGFAEVGLACRASAGACDLAESCTGDSAVCPGDARAAAGTICRAASGVCDQAEVCDGSAVACPADGFLPSTTSCRPSEGACDVGEFCTGSQAACPEDVLQPAGMVCRDAAGACDVAESCSGDAAHCPGDALQAPGTVCRGTVGACDVAEVCVAGLAACPVDGFREAGTMCREARGACDMAERCGGESGVCPSDAYVEDGSACDDGSSCYESEVCRGGTCGLGRPVDCDDFDPCTADYCDELEGCVNEEIDGCRAGEVDPEEPDPTLGRDAGVPSLPADADVPSSVPEHGGCSVHEGASESPLAGVSLVVLLCLGWRRRRRG